jgi:heptosyltransferase II
MNASPPNLASARILVRGVNWLGDAAMTTPALQRLREATSRSQITLLTHEKLADLWCNHPALDNVITFATGETVWRVARRLRAEQFDLSLILPNSARAALESLVARIPHRVGYAGNWRSPLLTQTVTDRPGAAKMRKRSRLTVEWLARVAPSKPRAVFPASAHHMHRYLHLAAAIGADPTPVAPQVYVHADEVRTTIDKFNILPDSPASPLLGLNAGAEYGPAKCWPRDRFAAVAMQIFRQTNCRWVLFGGQGDIELVTEMAAWLESVAAAHSGTRLTPAHKFVWNLAGRTSLRELCALLKACRVLLTNDTGPMHVAAAVETSVVVPFGSTSPELTGPGLPRDDRHRLLLGVASCAPCFRRECPIDFRCMNTITVEQVVDAVMSRLADNSRPHPIS